MTRQVKGEPRGFVRTHPSDDREPPRRPRSNLPRPLRTSVQQSTAARSHSRAQSVPIDPTRADQGSAPFTPQVRATRHPLTRQSLHNTPAPSWGMGASPRAVSEPGPGVNFAALPRLPAAFAA
jgi:hypothetical protein